MIETTAYRAIQGVTNARSLLEHGFTTIRDLGNSGNYADLDLKQAINEGWIPGPDMQVVGRIIAPFGGQFQLQPELPELIEPEYLIADTQDEIRKAIHQNLHYGTDLIKMVVDDFSYIYTEEDLRFAVDEVTRAGTKLATHVTTINIGYAAGLLAMLLGMFYLLQRFLRPLPRVLAGREDRLDDVAARQARDDDVEEEPEQSEAQAVDPPVREPDVLRVRTRIHYELVFQPVHRS